MVMVFWGGKALFLRDPPDIIEKAAHEFNREVWHLLVSLEPSVCGSV